MKRSRPYPHFLFPDEIVITYCKISADKCKWHNLNENSYILCTENYGWFPTEILMGVINGKFSDTNKIGANVGNNLGTSSIGIVDLEKSITILKSNGYLKIYEKTI